MLGRRGSDHGADARCGDAHAAVGTEGDGPSAVVDVVVVTVTQGRQVLEIGRASVADPPSDVVRNAVFES